MFFINKPRNMNNRINIIAAMAIIAMVGVSSCKKDEVANQALNDEVLKRYMAVKSTMGSFQERNGSANLQALGLGIIFNMNNRFKSAGDSAVADTVVTDSAFWDNYTCAEVIDSIDENGNNYFIYDYGIEGCDFLGSLIKGKITYIWSQQNEIYTSKVIYDNYSGYGLTMNGFSEYTYTVDNMTFLPEDSASINWSGSSSCTENIEMVTAEGETYSYTGNYSSEWDNNSYTVHEGEYSYKNLTQGYEYTYKVSKDLYYNYTCSETYVPVSGIEEIIQKENNTTTSFVTDYGNGTCDNLATISENGTSYLVDFGEQWFCPDCGGSSDSTVYYLNEGK
jgi:hypothetical protein